MNKNKLPEKFSDFEIDELRDASKQGQVPFAILRLARKLNFIISYLSTMEDSKK